MKFIAAALFALSTVVSAVPASKRATCTNPVVHVEWRSLTTTQRNSYHAAVKCLQTKRAANGQTVFDRYPNVHDNIFGTVHYVAQFLPWHRWFLWLRRLDLIDCGYTGPTPYWDWTKDNANLANSPIWDATTGFGGNGNTANRNRCVQSGPYSQNQFQLSYPSRHCLSRNWNIRRGDSQYSPATVSSISNEATYLRFSNRVEVGPHDAIHNAVAGDMAAAWSPNDALFFLHHQYIDFLWAKWQGNGTRLQEYGGNTVQGQGQTDGRIYPLANVTNLMPTQGIRGLADIPVSEAMNTQAGSLCYVYQ